MNEFATIEESLDRTRRGTWFW